MVEKKLTMIQKVLFRFVLFFKKGENYTEAEKELSPKTILILEEGTLLFLEIDKTIIKNEGVVIPEKYISFVRYIVVVPNPEFGCLYGRSIVEFGTFIEREGLRFVPVQHDDNNLVRDYIILNPGIVADEKKLGIIFVAVTASKPTIKTVDISVNLNVREFVCETEPEEDGMIRYLLRCPTSDDHFSFGKKQFDEKVHNLFKDH